MLKVFNNESIKTQIFEHITDVFLDYMPVDKFQEVQNVEEADLIFAIGESRGTSLNVRTSEIEPKLSNLGILSKLYGSMAEKRWIIWLDTLGPELSKDSIFDLEQTGLRESDILISSSSVPFKSNVFTHIYPVEKTVFRKNNRFERLPKSVVISHDNITNLYEDGDTTGMIIEVLDVISHLYVTKSAGLGEEMEERFGGKLNKVSCNNFSYPRGLVKCLSKSEFVLHTHLSAGVEFLGIEAGMVGCQPIYPDTEFYRDIFDGTGVVFYDPDNFVESLIAIIEAGSNFDNEVTEAFRAKFNAEDHLPGFWDEVYELSNK